MIVKVLSGKLANLSAANVDDEDMPAPIVVENRKTFAETYCMVVGAGEYHRISGGGSGLWSWSSGDKRNFFAVRRPSHVVPFVFGGAIGPYHGRQRPAA